MRAAELRFEGGVWHSNRTEASLLLGPHVHVQRPSHRGTLYRKPSRPSCRSRPSPCFHCVTSSPTDYGSNLGDFLDAHAAKNITNIHSVKDLANSWEEIEAAFCDKEE